MKVTVYIGVMKGTEHYDEPIYQLTDSLQSYGKTLGQYTWYRSLVDVPMPAIYDELPGAEAEPVEIS